MVVPTARCPYCDYDLSATSGETCPECGHHVAISDRVGPPPPIAARCALAAALAFGCVVAGLLATHLASVPKPWAPWPAIIVVPLVLQKSYRFGIAATCALPILTGVATIRAQRRPTMGSYIVAGLMALLSWIYFINGIRFALEYQSLAYVLVCGAVNLAATAALITLGVRLRTRGSYLGLFAFHAILCLWVATYAFPYMGELP